MAMLSRFLLTLIGKVVRRPVLRHLAAFEEATHRPRDVQETLLRRILARHADTAFSRDHGLAGIQTVADFRRRLPIAGYDHFEPYITRLRHGETRALLGDERIHMFAHVRIAARS